ncbi:hypothetical protein Zmor_019628 [Zophobas morio]|uniref:HMG box domain-containing protein n=1 Tax=Zophobas morio TaxID=2755281 RepID=A0AA38M9M1_9CUCU|nr:hypothetical protein Zmor_019628 [Zophobas morio]
MPKRKPPQPEQPSKKPKLETEESPPAPAPLTKRLHHPQKDTIAWPNDDILELLTKIEANLPQDDNLKYCRRLEKLDWEVIPFKSHSIEACKNTWSALYRQVRKYRLLREVVTDMKEMIGARKVSKHPEKPKQPWNSYMFFVEEKRPVVVNANPNLHPHLISKKLGQMFKDLSGVEKERYETLAKAARQEYTEKLHRFYEEHPEMIPKKTKRSKPVQFEEGRGPPQKAKTPFELYVTVESEKEASDVPNFIVMKKCREQWNELSDKEKFFWINWADELYSKYLEDLKEYVKDHPEYTPEKIKPVITKKERKIKERCSGKPDKPPHGSYHLFSKMILESDEVRNINSKDLMNYVSEKWRACSDEEKNEYKVRVEQLWEDYHQKLEEYLMTLPPEDRDRIREEESRKKYRNEGKSPVAKKPPPVKVSKPELPPSTLFKYFLKVYTGDEDATTVWKKLTREEKQPYEQKLNEERQTYIKDYEAYLKTLSREELEKLGQSLTNQYSSESESESETSTETN